MTLATLEIIDTLFLALALIFGVFDLFANIARRGKRDPKQQGVRISVFTLTFGGGFLLVAIGVVIYRLLGGS